MNPYQCQLDRICLTNPYFCVTKFHNPSLLICGKLGVVSGKKTEIRSKFLENENNIKKRLHTIFSIPNERGGFSKSEAWEYEDEYIEDEGDTHFLRIQKTQLTDWM